MTRPMQDSSVHDPPRLLPVQVGTGLTDADRRKPPAIDSIVTYKYFELSASLNPRFPSFIGVRTDIDWDDYCASYVL